MNLYMYPIKIQYIQPIEMQYTTNKLKDLQHCEIHKGFIHKTLII
jgi:hypothetical protein